MRPYKRTPARKKNVRSVRKLPDKLGGKFPTNEEQINRYGYCPSIHEVWDNNWLLPPVGIEAPENYVRIKKAQHLAYVPEGSILFVKTEDPVLPWSISSSSRWGGNSASENFALSPSPLSVNWKTFVEVSPNWVPKKSKYLSGNRTRGEWLSVAPASVWKEFVQGFIYFEKIRRGYKESPRAQGTYMFGGLPQLLFSWKQCMVGEDGLLAIVAKLKHGKEIYEKELNQLGIYDEAVGK